MFFDQHIHHSKIVGMKNIIMTDHRHEFAFLYGSYPRPIFFDTQRLLRRVNTNAIVFELLYPLNSIIGTTTIQYDQVEIRKCLRKNAFYAFPNMNATIPHR